MMTHREIADQLQIFRNAWVAGKGVFRDSWGDGVLTQAIAALEAKPLAEGWLAQIEGHICWEDHTSRILSVYLDYAPTGSRRVAIYGADDA
jgi:hypothetical protein